MGTMAHPDNTTTSQVNQFIADKYANLDVSVHPVEGGYSRNRRAIIDVGDKSVFAKEVDANVLPDDGELELDWLRKDYEVVSELGELGMSIVPGWAELHLKGHLLLMPSYKQEDGWRWSLSANEAVIPR